MINATMLSCHARIFSSLDVPISLSVLPEALRRGLHPMPSWFPMRPTALAILRSRCSTRLWLASWKRFWHHSKIMSGMYRASSRRSFDPFSIVACSPVASFGSLATPADWTASWRSPASPEAYARLVEVDGWRITHPTCLLHCRNVFIVCF